MLLNQALAQALLGVLIICALSLGAASISTCLRLIYETWWAHGKPPEDDALETEQVKAYSIKYADRISQVWLIGPENNVGKVSAKYELNNDWTLVATETGLPGGYLDITIYDQMEDVVGVLYTTDNIDSIIKKALEESSK